MFAMLPEQWSQKVKEQNLKKQKHQEAMKRKASDTRTEPSPKKIRGEDYNEIKNEIKLEPDIKQEPVEERIEIVTKADNNISCLFEDYTEIKNQIKLEPDDKLKPDEKRIKIIIKADNPISCLYEYASKKKISVPEFSRVVGAGSPTMEVKVEGQTYKASSNRLKAAKAACASLAWDKIKALL